MYNIFTNTGHGFINSSQIFFKVLTVCYLLATFINRDLSNIFLILLILFSLFYVIVQRVDFSRKEVIALVLIVLFTTLVVGISVFHGSPISEVDSYSRAFLMFPIYLLLRNISFSRNELIYTFSACLICSFLLYQFGGDEIYHGERFQGSSSTPLTYGNMLMTLILILIVTINTSLNYNFLLKLIVIAIGIFLVFQTGTKGSVVGLIITLPVILYLNKELAYPVIIIIAISIAFAFVTPFYQRIANFTEALGTIDVNNLTNSTDINFSVNERLYYYQFSIETIEENVISGIGPHMFEKKLQDDINMKKLNIKVSDHAHNEFLDIFAKFGAAAFFTFLALLFYLIYVFMKYKDNYLGQSGLVVVISQAAYMLTQSQFAHHQAIVFFLLLVYVISSQIKQIKKYKTIEEIE